MASKFDGIQLTPSDDTKRKIATLAVLTGQNVSIVIGQLEELLNQTLTEKCIQLLGGDAGKITYPIAEEIEEIPVKEDASTPPAPNIQVRAKKLKSFADVQKEVLAPPPIEHTEEAFSAIEGAHAHVPRHELSDDEDVQDNKSLEEQIEEEDALDPEETAALKHVFDETRFKSVGKNAEAFLDGALGEPEEQETDEIPSVTRGHAGQGPYGERPIKATKSFESRLRKGQRARVSFHTGDED